MLFDFRVEGEFRITNNIVTHNRNQYNIERFFLGTRNIKNHMPVMVAIGAKGAEMGSAAIVLKLGSELFRVERSSI